MSEQASRDQAPVGSPSQGQSAGGQAPSEQAPSEQAPSEQVPSGHGPGQPSALSASDRESALATVPDWRYDLRAIHAAYRCLTARAALELVAAVGDAAEGLDHHPDLDWRYRHVFLRLSTHTAGDVTRMDVQLAALVSAAARRLGATPAGDEVRLLELAVDTADPHQVKGFWRAALGYRDGPDDELVDPWGRNPTVWFQHTPTPDASRIHLDVTVAPHRADPILDEVTGAGGRRIEEGYRPAFTVTADADGNRVCICTSLGRDEADLPTAMSSSADPVRPDAAGGSCSVSEPVARTEPGAG